MQTPSHTLLGIQHDRETSDELSLSAIGKAFAQADLNMVHEILLDDGYTEYDMANSEVSYLFSSNPCFRLVSFQLCKEKTMASMHMFCM
jgi:hypothetical protein